MITVNLEKAKEAFRSRLRTERIPLFKEKDLDFVRAIEASDVTLQQIVAKDKQTLRDIPQNPAIGEAKTLEELISCWPLELGPNPFLPVSAAE